LYCKDLAELGTVVAEADISQFSRARNKCCGSKLLDFASWQSRTQYPQASWSAGGRREILGVLVKIGFFFDKLFNVVHCYKTKNR